MSQLYLPAEHTEADLVLAGSIAEQLGSGELYVVWTEQHGPAVAEVAALLRDPAPHWSDALALVFQAVRELWMLLLGRDATAPRMSGVPAASEAAAPRA